MKKENLKLLISIIITIILINVAVAVWVFDIKYEYEIEEDTKYEDTKNFIIRAFQNGTWNGSEFEGYILHADEEKIAENSNLLKKYENGWYRFPGKLISKDGPWKYKVYIWYNENTNETHIQRKGVIE